MDSYRVEIDNRAKREIRTLPGHMRQRVIRLIRDLETQSRPPTSRQLDVSKAGLVLEPGMTLHRITVETWRVVYLIEEEWRVITVLAVRKRPPYQYSDLSELLTGG
jgi:mRNA interferase RelE/StbE